MPGFSSLSDMTTEVDTNGKQFTFEFYKTSSAPEAAGVWHSLWTAAGKPTAGAAPAGTPGAAYTDSANSMFFRNVSTDQKHILSFGGQASIACTLMVYDRLVGVGGISLTTTGAKTVNSAALGRYTGTSAERVQCWLEVSTATTTTAPVVNLNQYTNEAGTTGRSGGSITFPAVATNVDAFIGPMPIQVGDKGIRSVEVGLNVGTAAATGAVSVILLRPLMCIPLPANQWIEVDGVLQTSGLTRVFDGASLSLALLATSASAVSLAGQIRLGYG